MAHLVCGSYDNSMSSLEKNVLPATAILGVGAMGGAILEGLLSPGVEFSVPVNVTTFTDASSEKYSSRAGVIAHSLESDPEANLKAVAGAKVVIIGVKPHMIIDLIKEIASHLAPNTVLISVAAGVEIETIQKLLPSGVTVVRAMPNTPSLVRRGVTGITASSEAPRKSLDLARELFETVGKVIILESESQLNSLTAASGGGPAYVFLFIEKMTDAVKKLGFSASEAKIIVEETFLGASLLLEKMGADPKQLRQDVTSPSGTTEQALKRFESARLDVTISEALKAAIDRAEELAELGS